MKIKYMGTAAGEGWPALFCECEYCRKARELGGKNIRKRTCTMIDRKLLIDFGPDILSHVHTHDLNLTQLDAILITHSHEDHLYPGDLSLTRKPFGYFERESVIKVVGNERVEGLCEAIIRESPSLEFVCARAFEPLFIGEYLIHPLLAQHGDGREKSLFYIIENDGTLFLNGNDTNYFPESTWEYLQMMKYRMVSLDTNNGNGHADEIGKPGHMNIPMVLKVKERLVETGCVDDSTLFIMNHFSHNGMLMHHELEAVGREHGFEIAYDGYAVEI